MDNVHKRHLFEMYSSADEEIDDINELQDEYKSVSSEEDCVLFDLEENFVSNRQLSPEILEKIKFLVNIDCGAGPIIRALQNIFSETVIHPKVEDWNDLLKNEITVGEGQDEDGEDNEDYEDGEDGEDGNYGDDDDEDEQSDDEEQDDVDTRSEKLNFFEDDYESSIVNLHTLITYHNHANIHEFICDSGCMKFCNNPFLFSGFGSTFQNEANNFHINLLSIILHMITISILTCYFAISVYDASDELL
ncbi:hypothetical protein C1646_675218 [Rhizophagus diaphanus]|nr:hypothetical protein C1646_675218 [Rhizophagus diaphanus] [Rhizophagus sp. MUCL 43196]